MKEQLQAFKAWLLPYVPNFAMRHGEIAILPRYLHTPFNHQTPF
jgi:hypothetical protein